MNKNYDEQPIIAQIQPKCDEFNRIVKEAKKSQGKTNQDIADATGIPLSNLSKYLSGNLSNPSIYNAVAVCIYLGISIDEAFGIRNHTEESEHIAELEAKVHDLEKDLYYCRKDRDNMEKVLKSRKTFITALFGICILLITAFSFAVIYDSARPEEGFIHGGSIAPISFICITTIVIAIAVTVAIIQKEKR